MYYYQIVQHATGSLIVTSNIPHDTREDAMEAARDYLTMYGMLPYDWPADINIFNGFPGDPSAGAYVVDYATAYESEIREYALKRIEKANAAVLQYEIKVAIEEFNAHKEQYDRGLITPLEFAQTEEGDWIRARTNIELLTHR
jgi:hypothetical protein